MSISVLKKSQCTAGEVKSGQKISHPGEGSGKDQKVSYIRNEGPGEGQKVLYPDEGRRGSKNVRMRHERAKKVSIRMRAGDSQRMSG